jgi:hypothetical protein
MLSKHNPYCRLISKKVYEVERYLDLVYCINNEGTEESLEVYYYRISDNSGHFYRSYRWLESDIPEKYYFHFEDLKSYVSDVPDGHKLIL